MAKSSKKNKGNKISVDFEGVQTSVSVPEADYIVKPVAVTKEEGNEYDYLQWSLEIQKGQHKGKKLRDNTSLSPAALWRLKSLLEVGGIEVPDSALDIDLDTICDDFGEFAVTVEHEDYEGRKQMRVTDYFSAEDAEESEEDDDDDKGKKAGKKDKDGKKSGKKNDAEESGGDLPSEEDVMELDEDELEEVIDEHDLDVDLDDHKKLKDKRKAVWEAIEAKGEGGEESSEGGDDDLTEDKVNEMGTKELEALVKEHKLKGVELDGTTKKKRRTVIKALKKAGVLED